MAVLLAGIPLQAQAQAMPGREVSAEVSFVGTSGNSSTQTIGLGGELVDRLNSWEARTKTGYVRNESESVLKAESFNLSLAGARVLSERLSIFARHGYLRDKFAGIENRNTPEGGVSYAAVMTAPHRMVVDAAVGYAFEGRVSGVDLSNGTFSLGALYTLKLSETAEFSNDWRGLTSLEDAEDRRMANIMAISARLTTILSLKVSHTLRIVNAPPPGFRKTDAITAVALVVKF
jgi:putative salt-induced outer membrane protein YdiY